MISATTTRRQEGLSRDELNATLKQKAIPLRDGRTVTLTVSLDSGWIAVDVWDGDDSIELLSKNMPSEKAWAACRKAAARVHAAFEAAGGWAGYYRRQGMVGYHGQGVAAWHREQAALKAA